MESKTLFDIGLTNFDLAVNLKTVNEKGESLDYKAVRPCSY